MRGYVENHTQRQAHGRAYVASVLALLLALAFAFEQAVCAQVEAAATSPSENARQSSLPAFSQQQMSQMLAPAPDHAASGDTHPNISGGRADRLYKRVPPSPPGTSRMSRRPPPESRIPAVRGTGRKDNLRNESERDSPEDTPWHRRNEREPHPAGDTEDRMRPPR